MQTRLPKKARRLIGALFLCALLLCAYVGNAGRQFYARQSDAYRAQAATLQLPPLPEPTSQTRLLVFAPHCDDDVLGCAGLIQRTLRAGGKVRVITMTNGDGFRTAVQKQERRLRVEPNDFMQFAYRRQEESVKALTSLGVDKSEIFFLGYPDRGLSPMWNDFWKPERPYTSRYTRCQRSPYKNAKTPGAIYCGESAFHDVEQALREFAPTLITVTHPDDDHIDHTAASAFVTLALEIAQGNGEGWAEKAQLLYYLVHRGNWPAASKNRNDDALNPPAEMSHLDTDWFSFPISPKERKAKEAAIRAHATQTAMTEPFLLSFACRNELFGTLDVGNILANKRELRKVIENPATDSFPRAQFGEGDIQSVEMEADRDALRVVLKMRENASPRVRYQLQLRGIGRRGETSSASLLIQTNDSEALKRQGIKVFFEGKKIQFEIPVSLVRRNERGAYCFLGVSVETFIARVEIDKTGVHLVSWGGIM